MLDKIKLKKILVEDAVRRGTHFKTQMQAFIIRN